jgi:hypothetical protein
MLGDLDQEYLGGSGLEGTEDEDFLLLIKTPIRRFSRGSLNPLSLEMLQVRAHQWIREQPFVLDNNWLESMVKSVGGDLNMNEVVGALRKVGVMALECEWRLCAECHGQLI